MAGELAARAKALVDEVVEEETGRKLGELTIVTEIFEVTPGVIKVRFTPLSVYSPTAVELGKRIKTAAQSAEGARKVVVECSGHMDDVLVNRLVNT